MLLSIEADFFTFINLNDPSILNDKRYSAVPNFPKRIPDLPLQFPVPWFVKRSSHQIPLNRAVVLFASMRHLTE
jgi:hypothetical protein